MGRGEATASESVVYGALDSAAIAQVVVVGAGYAGHSTVIALAGWDIDVAVVETPSNPEGVRQVVMAALLSLR